MRRTADKHKLKDILQNSWPVLPKVVKVIKNNEPWDTKETWRTVIAAMEP